MKVLNEFDTIYSADSVEYLYENKTRNASSGSGVSGRSVSTTGGDGQRLFEYCYGCIGAYQVQESAGGGQSGVSTGGGQSGVSTQTSDSTGANSPSYTRLGKLILFKESFVAAGGHLNNTLGTPLGTAHHTATTQDTASTQDTTGSDSATRFAVLQQLHSSAILDIKWRLGSASCRNYTENTTTTTTMDPTTRMDSRILATATATGHTVLYRLDLSLEELVECGIHTNTSTNTLAIDDCAQSDDNNDDCDQSDDNQYDECRSNHSSLKNNHQQQQPQPPPPLILSLDWSPHSSSILASSTSQGTLCLIDTSLTSPPPQTSHKHPSYTLPTISQWKAHDFECWICAWSPSSPTLYSGGDDTLFKAWDTRSPTSSNTRPTPIFVNKSHTAGVTAIARDPFSEWRLATGSYDECVRIWDTRMLDGRAVPVQSIHVPGGGIWRIKFHSRERGVVATASMYAGFHLIDLDRFDGHVDGDGDGGMSKYVVEEFKSPHESIAYGIDWSPLVPHPPPRSRSSSSSRCVEEELAEICLTDSSDCGKQRVLGTIGTCSFYDHRFCLWNAGKI